MPENTDSPRGEHWPVCVEILEAEDVKEADGLSDLVGLPGRLVNGRIDFVHHPNEKTAVNSLADHKENHFCHKVCPPKHNRFTRTHTVNYQQNKICTLKHIESPEDFEESRSIQNFQGLGPSQNQDPEVGGGDGLKSSHGEDFEGWGPGQDEDFKEPRRSQDKTQRWE